MEPYHMCSFVSGSFHLACFLFSSMLYNMFHSFLPFCGQIIFQGMHLPYCTDLLVSWWTLGLFLPFGYCEQHCGKHLSMRFCVDKCELRSPSFLRCSPAGRSLGARAASSSGTHPFLALFLHHCSRSLAPWLTSNINSHTQVLVSGSAFRQPKLDMKARSWPYLLTHFSSRCQGEGTGVPFTFHEGRQGQLPPRLIPE